jgi:hypothetical protein
MTQSSVAFLISMNLECQHHQLMQETKQKNPNLGLNGQIEEGLHKNITKYCKEKGENLTASSTRLISETFLAADRLPEEDPTSFARK